MNSKNNNPSDTKTEDESELAKILQEEQLETDFQVATVEVDLNERAQIELGSDEISNAIDE